MTELLRGQKGQPRKIVNGVDLRVIHDVPAAPSYFDKEATALWDETCAILIDRRVLTEADLGVVETYVHNMILFRQASIELGKNGVAVTKSNGDKALNPAFNVRRNCEMQIQAGAVQLGLTPRARRTMKVTDTETDSEQGGNAGGAF